MSKVFFVQTKIPNFKAPKTVVRRRFSDFLALHSKLAEKPEYVGRIIPPAPEKSVMGQSVCLSMSLLYGMTCLFVRDDSSEVFQGGIVWFNGFY